MASGTSAVLLILSVVGAITESNLLHESYAEIGKIYGVTGECVGNVVRGVTFRNAASELVVTFYDLPEV